MDKETKKNITIIGTILFILIMSSVIWRCSNDTTIAEHATVTIEANGMVVYLTNVKVVQPSKNMLMMNVGKNLDKLE